ncbi:unnamed protein product [Rhizophagus irregularis]|nr:unnamed protein product [Rhizophagus irregularis]
MNSKIAAFHISMIPQRWYKNLYQDETNLQEKVIFNNKEVEQEDDEITLILQDYIKRKSNRNMPERLPTIVINERFTINEVSDNP